MYTIYIKAVYIIYIHMYIHIYSVHLNKIQENALSYICISAFPSY